MKKKFKVEEVDCANCAAKMEALIKKIDGVNDASLNFLTQKLILDGADDRFDEIVEEAESCMKKIDSGAHIVR